jgi:hypothetical protein
MGARPNAQVCSTFGSSRSSGSFSLARGRPNPRAPERTGVLDLRLFAEFGLFFFGARAPQPARAARRGVLDLQLFAEFGLFFFGARAPQPARGTTQHPRGTSDNRTRVGWGAARRANSGITSDVDGLARRTRSIWAASA